MDNSSIGALAIAEGNHNHIWAGTGETFLIRPAHANGNGIYKSVDGGKSWKNMGLNERDRWAINDFLNNSEKSVQTIRDHYWHKSRLTGGLSGFHLKRMENSPNGKDIRNGLKSKFSELLEHFSLNTDNIQYGDDESILNSIIFPLIKEELLVYSNINVYEGETYKVIDYEINNNNFCGNVVVYHSITNNSEQTTEYNKSYQFNYYDFPILKQIIWLYNQNQSELVISLIDEYGFHRIPFNEKSFVLDYVILSLIKRNSINAIQECFIKYQEFAKYDILNGIKNQTAQFFNMVRSLGYSIIGTCDTEYEPKLMEFVIYYGNYPDDYMALPQSFRIYQHFMFFNDIKLDRFISNKCWDNIDRIFIMGLENGFERMNNTWMHLCSMNAPLDRIQEYRAKKDANLKDIYIGATKNHLDCLQLMRDNSYNHCLFLEDDFVFTSNIRENQDSLYKFFENDYDYNICFLSASKLHERKVYDDFLLLSKQICTTSSAYLVSKKNLDIVLNTVKEGYELLLKYPDQSYIFCIDRYWTKLDKLFIFKKKLGFQSPSMSKITGKMNIELD
jgi:hypothetical protein